MKILEINPALTLNKGTWQIACLRGAHKDYDAIALQVNAKVLFNIIWQKNIRFMDLNGGDFEGAASVSEALEQMKANYVNFDSREIVTLIKFEVI